MSKLSPSELRGRRSLDYTLMKKIDTTLWKWVAYPSAAAWSKKGRPIRSEAEGWCATFYVVTFALPVMTGPDSVTNSVTVTLDTSSRGYPFAAPNVYVVSRPLPWNPHVSGGGFVCLGPIWQEAAGRMTLPQLVVHSCKLLNLEMPRSEHTGYSSEAHAYWANVLQYGPVNKGVKYPTLPTGLYDGSVRPLTPPPVDVPANTTRAFRIVGRTQRPSQGGLTIVGRKEVAR